jgi:hypothetical protein
MFSPSAYNRGHPPDCGAGTENLRQSLAFGKTKVAQIASEQGGNWLQIRQGGRRGRISERLKYLSNYNPLIKSDAVRLSWAGASEVRVRSDADKRRDWPAPGCKRHWCDPDHSASVE